MYKHFIKRSSQKLLECLKTINKSPIAFYGASLFLKEFLEENKLSEYNILGIIDSDTSKQNTLFCGYKVISLTELQNINNCIVVSTIKNNYKQNYNNILDQIKTLGFNNVQVLFPDYFIIKNILITNPDGTINTIEEIPGLKINYIGETGIIEIENNPMPTFKNCEVIIHDNAYLKIGSSHRTLKNTKFSLSRNSKIIIGK